MEAWCNSLARLPAQFHADRAELLDLLRRDAILRASPTQPILSRDGSTARWMLNSLQVTLTPRGAELAGRCVLELLKRFEGRQIATIGLTAVPILNSCILQSGGRYHGLLVRPQRKQHGSLKLIEGPIDPAEPTIVLDDSISSGTSMQLACRHLEEAGLRVEGGIVLVRFGWYGGYARMQEQGYHVEAVSDIWNDFIYHMNDEPRPIGNPSKVFPSFEWSATRAPEKLHPAALARLALREYLTSGTLPRPPLELDADYPAAGGVWVSLRSLGNIHVRHARDGFWHFPGEETWLAARGASIWAALQTAATLPPEQALGLLDDSAIAVTFFTALEDCPVGELDNDRYGIVVRSLERPGWMGGALPRMPGILNEWDQYRHARMTNGRLVSFEPHVIFRHDVVKAVEPGVTWQPTGVPTPTELPPLTQATCGGVVAARARDIALRRLLGGEPRTTDLPDDLLPPMSIRSMSAFISAGGCADASGPSCAASTRTWRGWWRRRWPMSGSRPAPTWNFPTPSRCPSRFCTTASIWEYILSRTSSADSLWPAGIDGRAGKSFGAVSCLRSPAATISLPFLSSRSCCTRPRSPSRLIDGARFECTTWLADHIGRTATGRKFRARGCAGRPARPAWRGWRRSASGIFLRHQRPDGTFFTRYDPLRTSTMRGVDLPRLAHAAWVLARASKAFEAPSGEAAARTAGFLLGTVRETSDGIWLTHDGNERSVADISLLLLALCEASPPPPAEHWPPRLAAALWSRIDRNGRVHTHQDAAAASDAFQDYFPGQVLLALACAARAGMASVDDVRLARAFRYYRHRFHARPHFGQVSWLTQACHGWWRITRDRCFGELAFEIADWILGFQQRKTGAFLNDHQSDTPGYTTALYLEGLGAAASLARAAGEDERHHRYLEACRRGLQFLDGLVIQLRDSSLLPNPAMAIGGLRRSAQRSEICVDFVQHYLAAALAAHAAMQTSEA